MYSVSNAFLEEIKKKVQTHKVYGTIGSYSFDKSNIVSGTFHISNQCTDTSDVTLGAVYIGQLEATFTGLNIGYTDWIGKTITPIFGLKLGNNQWEDVPLGVYRIIEAHHTAEGVAIVASDNMRKFDRKFKKSRFQMTGGLQAFIDQACQDCHVTFGMTDEEVEALPNGLEVVSMFGVYGKTKDFANDIETYRDLIFWIAQTLGCFATMDRLGRLVFRRYTRNIVDTISQTERLAGAEFEDYITNYTGIYVNNMKDDSESYYGYDVELLQAEIALVESQISQVNSALAQNASDMYELEQKHSQGQITDEEYRAQKVQLEQQAAQLTKTKKQLQKRLNWLLKALEKAQSNEDGTYMELGDNPFLQDDIASYRERERRAVLGALDDISYTPFTCSTVMGIHYDLGDVLYFTGGHAGDDGVFCCLMMYDWNFNGEYQMQGFGADPSIANVKDKVEKKADQANKNALAANEISSGTDIPVDSDGKEDDIYIKYGQRSWKTSKYEIISQDKYSRMTDTNYVRPVGQIDAESVEWNDQLGSYRVILDGKANYYYSGQGYYNWNWGMPVLTVKLPESGTYKWHCDIEFSYSENSVGNSSPDAFLGIIFGTDPATGGSHSAGVPSNPSIGVGSVNGNEIYFNVDIVQNHAYHYEGTFETTSAWYANGELYMYLWYHRLFAKIANLDADGTVILSNLYFEKIDETTGEGDGGYDQHIEQYIDKIYVKEENPLTGESTWKEIEYLASVDETAHSGLSVDERKKVSLTPEVMRAWFKADPPQVNRNFNQYCVRFTGKPDSNIDISLQSNTGWLNKSIKKDSEGVFILKSGGTVSSGAIEYCAYKITGLTSGQRYYFNFKCNFKDGTTFGNNTSKGLGLVFNTTGTIDTDDWSGEPNTFDEENLYYSMRRSTVGNFANFSFVATASTMYMCVVVADITSGQTSSLTLSKFVISNTEREYVRDFYIFDIVSNDWLPYKPWGSGSDSGDAGASSLGDLDDVNLQSLTNGQTLYYNSATGEWVNGNAYELPIASANVLGGIKVGANLSIDENGVLSAESGGASAMSDLADVDIDDQTLDAGQVLKWDAVNEKWVNEDEAGGTTSVELTKAEYDALPSADKNDPTKVYYVKNYQPVPQGSNMSDLEDVLIDDQTLDEGQVLKWDSVNEQWVNDDESGGTTVIANPTGTPTEQLNTIQIGEDIYEIVGGGGSGSGYSRTNLWSGEQRGPMEVPLSDDINNYDAIEFVTKLSTNGAYNVIIVDAKSFSTKYPYSASVSQNIPHYCLLGYDNLFGRVITGQTTSSLYIWDLTSTMRLAEVNGIKYETGGSGTGDLADLDDVDLGTLANGDILQYNSTTQKWENSTPAFTLPVASASTLGGIKIGDLFKMTANNALDMEFGRFLFTASGVATIASSDTYSKQVITVSKLMYRRISQYVTQTISYSNCILAIESVSLHNMSASGILYGDEEYARTKISVSEIADNGNSYDITILISNDMGLYISDFEIWVTGTYIGNPVIT